MHVRRSAPACSLLGALLASATAAPSQVTPGLPSFAFLHQILPVDSEQAACVALGDVDRDGDPDVFVGNRFGRGARRYLNDGDGRFADVTETHVPPGGERVSGCALADVDMDGDLDAYLATGAPNGEQDRLFVNDGTGRFTDETVARIPADTRWTSEVEFGDIDGDGDPDAVLAGFRFFDPPATRVLENLGNGVFVEALGAVPASTYSANAIALADFDGDRDLDLLLAGTGQKQIWLNDGSGTFTDATAGRIPAASSTVSSLSVGDVDGDLDFDVLLGHADQAQSRLWLNDGGATFRDVTATNLPMMTAQTAATLLVDVDGDRDLDAVLGNVSNILDGQNFLWLNDGEGRFTERPLEPFLDSTAALAAADVDGDGDVDLYVANNQQNTRHGQDRLLLNDGSGTFTDVTTPKLPGDWDFVRAIAAGDLDGDRSPDLFVVGPNGAPLREDRQRVYLNDGAAGFVDATTPALDAPNTTAAGVALGDVDGDGDLDAFVANEGGIGQPNRLYVNDGTGGFTDASAASLPRLTDQSRAVALGDLDGDGDLDAFIGNISVFGGGSNARDNRVYLNDGSGVFAHAANALPADDDWTERVALGDFDGDGDLDAVAGNAGAFPTPLARLYINLGDGTFQHGGSGLPQRTDWTGALVPFDADGDRDLDLLIAVRRNANTSGVNRLLLNDGSGSFTDVSKTALPQQTEDTRAACAVDFDGDGDLDLLLADRSVRLHLNDGRGVFTDFELDVTARQGDIAALACADYDGDGDSDVLVGNARERNRLLTNLGSQLAWRQLPRIGRNLDFDHYGPAGGLWGICFSTLQVDVPTPFGRLRVDGPRAFLSDQGPLDAHGFASFTWRVPPNPALVDATLYVQSVVGAPILLTNLEVITLRGL